VYIKERGLCGYHYRSYRRAGTLKPLTTIDRFWMKVHRVEGQCWEWTGGKYRGGYGSFWGGDTTYAHRFSYQLLVSPIPEGMLVDHICLNKGCVNPDHLRLATKKQNNEHLAPGRANNSSGYRGVAWHKLAKKWTAQVGHEGRIVYLGCFDTAEGAAEAARLKRIELHTHNALDRSA
jgi:hypothetical protein